MVQLCYNGGQSMRKKAQLLIASVEESYEMAADVPTQLNILSCRAKPAEKCRMRCIDADCKHRPQDERDAAADVHDPQADLQQDDLEETGLDDNLEEEEEAGENEEIIQPPKAKRICTRDLWPFAQSVGYYQGLVRAFTSKSPTMHTVHVTRSAHPGPLLAGHSLGKISHVLVAGQSEHSKAHGQEILKDYLAEFGHPLIFFSPQGMDRGGRRPINSGGPGGRAPR